MTEPIIARSEAPRGPSKLALGCLVFGAIAVALTIYAGRWFFGAGEQIPTEVVVGPRSASFAQFAPLEGDEGVAALFGELLLAMEAKDRDPAGDRGDAVAAYFDRLEKYQGDGDLGALMPREVTVSAFDAGDGEDGWLVAVNFDGYGGLVKGLHDATAAMVESSPDDPGSVLEHDGHAIIDFDGALTTRVGSTLLIGSSAAAMRDVLDREVRPRGEPPEELVAIRDLLAGSFDGYAVTAAPEALQRWLVGAQEGGEIPPPFDQIDVAGIGVDVRTADRTEGKLYLHAPDPAVAVALQQAVDSQRSRLMEVLSARGLIAGFDTEADGRFVQVSFSLEGVSRALVDLIEVLDAPDYADAPPVADEGEPAAGSAEPQPAP